MVASPAFSEPKPIEVKPLNNRQTVTEQRTNIDVDVDVNTDLIVSKTKVKNSQNPIALV